LADGRGRVEEETLALIQGTLDDYGAGVEIRQVELQKVDPPAAVIDAFRDVQAARADQERFINEAQAYQNSIVPVARGEAQKIIQEAEAYKQEVTNDAEGIASRFLAVYNEYKLSKDVTRRRIYLETMEQILQNMTKMIIDSSAVGAQGVVPYLPLDQLQRGSGAGGQ
jgi:membrane protease subunit HflK